MLLRSTSERQCWVFEECPPRENTWGFRYLCFGSGFWAWDTRIITIFYEFMYICAVIIMQCNTSIVYIGMDNAIQA